MKKVDCALLKRCFIGAYEHLVEQKEMINELNVFPVPDGDTGTNMSLTMKAAIAQVAKAKDTLASIGKALGNGSLMGARGNSGVILSQLCRGASEALQEADVFNVATVCSVLEKAKNRAYKAVMKPTEGTILTVARSMSEFAEKHGKEYTDVDLFLTDVLAEAVRTLKKTPDMLPTLKEAGVVDAGGQGLVELLVGFLQVLTGRSTDELHKETQKAHHIDDDKYQYHVRISADGLSEDFSDTLHETSLSVSGSGEYEVYTNRPEAVLSHVIENGILFNMDVTSLLAKETKSVEPRAKFGFVSVSLGEGFDNIFSQLMVNEIVSGGQTMNPSTKDLYEAVERVHADVVYILPNNKNIILAAEQVNELSDKEVIVIPTTSIPQGFSALFHFDESLSAEENRANMMEGLSHVTTGQITYAIRDTEVGGLPIKKDDYLGIVDGKITDSSKNLDELLMKMLKENIDEEDSLLTLYAGCDVAEKDFEAMTKKVDIAFRDRVDCDFERGDQPTYFYIFSIE